MVNSKEVSILGIAIDWKLSFHQHTKVLQESMSKTKCIIENFPIPWR